MTPSSALPTSSRLEERATWLVSRAQARAGTLLREAFEADGDGLRGYHYRLLLALQESGPVSQADLGRRTGIDRSDVTAAVNLLEERRLVRRTVDPTHRRRNIVSLTSDGSTTLAELDGVVDGVQSRFLEPLSQAQRTQLLRLLARLAEG